MKNSFSVIGGDKRIVYLVQMLKQDGNIAKTYALENAQEINKEDKYTTIGNALENSQYVISSIPFSKDGENVYTPYSENELKIKDLLKNIQGKTLFAGNVKPQITNDVVASGSNNLQLIDLMQDEPLTIANAISTAEGAIQIAMEETTSTIHNSEILILGFGRIGKILAKNLQALGAKVTCEARKQEDLAWITAYGYNALHLKSLSENLKKYNIIFNTIPHLILDKEKLKLVNRNCLIIDLASKPGGIDFEECKKQGIKYNWALALPGKVAPQTSAKYIKETIYRMIEGK